MLKYREEARTAASHRADWLKSIKDTNGALMLLGRAPAASTRAGNTRVLFIEHVESRKTDVGDFFLREQNSRVGL